MPSVAIIGGGPAGLSAAVYAARANMDVTVLFNGDGALGKTDRVENYFGFAEPISGAELLQRGRAQARRLGAALVKAEVTGIEYAAHGFTVKTADKIYAADAVILATGAPRTAPNIAGIAELEGSGVSYCAICDAFFYRDKPVAVLGEGAYALEEVKVLLPTASSVTLLTNGSPVPEALPDGLAVDSRPVTAITGAPTVRGVSFADGDTLEVNGVFIAYGTAGSGDLARKLGAATEKGRVITDSSMATAVPGLFAAGDCTSGLLQIAKAVADGAQAALSAVRLLRK